ncbi:MAG: hypothetical protein E7673_05725 [Ruminococcaceae bacterium]|nr:hypothetical protein [Oscillospiraceae bacterium]
MKKITSLLLALTLVMGSLFVFASCGTPKDGGPEIKVYLGEKIYDFDPTDYYVDSTAELVMSLLYDPLFRVNEKGKLKCDGAADSYEVDETENTIVIDLKETYWSDGARVKADDYIYAWRNVLLNPNDANPAAALLYDIENAVKVKNGEVSAFEFGAVASETYQITIKYRNGANYEQLLKNLATVASCPIRQDIATNLTAGYWSKLVNTLVTNGPFMISHFAPDKSFTLARNEGYHQELGLKNPYKIVNPGKLIGVANATYADIENKVVFYMTDAPLSDRAANKKEADVIDDLSTYTYVFNTDRPLFKIPEVRKALSIAIDRNAIVNAITFAKAATGFLPDAVLDPDTGKSFNKDRDDLISASAKLSEAQALLSGVDFTGISKSFTLTINDDEESIAIANVVKAAWTALGFTVTVNPVSERTMEVGEGANSNKISDSIIQVLANNAIRSDFYGDDRGFDVLGLDWQMYSFDPFVALSAFAGTFNGSGVNFDDPSVSCTNVAGYSDASYDNLIKKAYNETNASAKSDILHDAEKKLVESACIVPLVFNKTFTFEHKHISKTGFDGFGNLILTDMKQKKYRQYLED